MEGDMFLYFKKDLHPETLTQTDETDWQELVPFDLFIKGVKFDSSAPVSYNLIVILI